MIELDRRHTTRGAVDRRADRLVAMTAISIALGFLVIAIASTALPVTTRDGLWLPLHLALAGAATTAIAGVMPFFSAAIATSQPVDARLRWASVVTVAVGAAGITLGVVRDERSGAAAFGVLFCVGAALVGYATLLPLRRGLGPRGGIVALGYAAAVAMVLVGAILGTLFLAGWPPVLEAWAYLKPVHAWLNLVGFVSLIIATTLLHFFPTVIGARIARVPAAYVTVIGLAAGPAFVAGAFGLDSDTLARVGAVLTMAGAAALAVYAAQVWRTRARWSGDRGWHRFAMGGLASAIAWFEMGTLLATSRLLVDGAEPAAVNVAVLVGPLVAGWMGLAVLASATHLVPSVGPGDPHEHGRQRVLLGRWGGTRLVLADAGVAGLTAGLVLTVDELTAAALLVVVAALGLTAGLLLAAVVSGIRNVRSARP
jgi:nitrite reductase (NO-forming)